MRCKQCGRAFWTAGSGLKGVCRTCEPSVSAEIARREAGIKDALIRLRYGGTGRPDPALCNAIETHARALLRFERLGIPTTRPSPTELLRMARARREELMTTEGDGGIRKDGPASRSGAGGRRRPGLRADRRRAERHRLQLAVRMDPGGIRAIARDVSASGVQLRADGVDRVRDRVVLTLYTADGPVRAAGAVRWSRPTAPGGGAGRGLSLGVAFFRPVDGLERARRR